MVQVDLTDFHFGEFTAAEAECVTRRQDRLARAIDVKMAPLCKLAMSDELVALNTQRGRILDELYGMTK